MSCTITDPHKPRDFRLYCILEYMTMAAACRPTHADIPCGPKHFGLQVRKPQIRSIAIAMHIAMAMAVPVHMHIALHIP